MDESKHTPGLPAPQRSAPDLALRDALTEARAVVEEQAEDEGLWFVAQTAPEGYLQAALRRLHAAVEGGKKLPAPPAARPPALEPYPRCTHLLREAGKPYPRTCQECGLGPCARGRT